MKSSVKRSIYGDATKLMLVPNVLYTIESCGMGIFSLFTASILGEFADAVFALDMSMGVSRIQLLIVVLVGSLIIFPIVSIVADIFMLVFSLKHDKKVLGRFLDKRYDAFLQDDIGDIQQRLESDPCSFRLCFNEFYCRGFMIPLTFAYLLYCVIGLHVGYALIVLGVTLVKLITPIIVRKIEGKFHRDGQAYASVRRALEGDLIERAYLVKMHGLGGAFIDRLDHLYHSFFLETEKKNIRYQGIVGAVNALVDTGCTLTILLVGACFVATQRITPGGIVAMFGYYGVFNGIIANISYLIRQKPILSNLADRLTIFYENSEFRSNVVVKQIESIEAHDLSFAFNDNEVLHKETFTLGRFDKVIICGANGAGKSTLIKILMGLYRGYTGSLKVDGVELSTIDMETYYSLIAYAPQDPYLFHGTVLENIQIGNPRLSRAEIITRIKNLHMEYLLDRHLGYGGQELSGGEKQKVSIARAIIKDAPMLFLDEPDNNLDLESQRCIEQIVKHSDKMVILISHNPQMTKNAGQVICLGARR